LCSMKRDIESILEGMLRDKRQREVVLIEGARQVGKSTLVNQVLAKLDSVSVTIDLGLKIPIECKAALAIRRRHTESVMAYLRTTHEPFGVIVSAAPLGVIASGDGYRVLNVPAYSANREGILQLASRR